MTLSITRHEINTLIKAGITPMVTLHHFTRPFWFDDKGGWVKLENLEYVVTFSECVFVEFYDRVLFFIPPGKGMLRQQIDDAVGVLQNLLVAHCRDTNH